MKLRELDPKDAFFMLEWAKDRDINQYFIFDFENQTLDSTISFIDASKHDNDNKHFAIADDADEYLGTISLKNIDKANKNAEYAISLRSKAQGKGIAKFATKTILDYAFDELGLNKVYLNVLSVNKRAIKFYKKFGFKYEGEFIQHVVKNGVFYDIQWYSMLKGERK